MQYFARVLLLTAGLGVFAIALSIYPSHPAIASVPGDPPSVPVKVTNTPLPVTGNVNAAVTSLPAVQISGTPNVNATITNGPVPVSGTVAVSNFPPAGANVIVGNTPANPVPTVATDNPDAEPFSWGQSVVIVGGSPGPGVIATAALQVPTTLDGKTVKALVIDWVSVSCGQLSNPAVGVQVATNLNGTNVNQFVPFPNGSDPSINVLGQTTRLYASSGTTVTMSLLATENAGVCIFSLSGHHVTQ